MSPSSPQCCERVRRWAALAPDGVLSELETRRLARHLETCPYCRDFGLTVRAFTEEIRSSPPEPPPQAWAPAAVPRVRARARRPSARAMAQRGAVLASVLIGIAIGTAGLRSLDERNGESPSPRTLVIVASGDEDTRAFLKGARDSAYAPRGDAVEHAQHPGPRWG